MFLERVSAARELLADDISRYIFDCRINYTQSGGDITHLLDMISYSLARSDLSYDGNEQLIALARKILASDKKCAVIIFGARSSTNTPLRLLYEYGLLTSSNISVMLCDNNPCLWGTRFAHHNPKQRLSIVSPYDIGQYAYDNNCYVLIRVNSRHSQQSIFNQCLNIGFSNQNIICPKAQFEYLIGTMYFDDKIMKPSADEIFVDIGAYDMGNTIDFIKWCGNNYRKIIAFEADAHSYDICKKVVQSLKSVELHNYAVYSADTCLSFLSAPDGEYGGSRIDGEGSDKVKAVTLDRFLGKDIPVSILKMDIEGAEKDALIGAENIIRQHKPRIVISAYHKLDDVVELPLLIKDLNPKYSEFYLRHHTCGIWDTVLYAI